MLKFLQKNGSSIYKKYFGQSLLHISIQKENYKTMIYLSKKLNINSYNKYQQTPLIICSKMGFSWSLQFFLSLKNIEINKKDENGKTALHYAVENSDIICTYKLLVYNSKRYIKNNDDLTPYEICKKNKDFDLENLFYNKNFFKSFLNCKMSVNEMKSLSKIFFMVFLIGINYLFIIIFIFPYLKNIRNNFFLFFTQIFLQIYFFFIKFSNPGFQKKNLNKDNLLNNLEKYNYNQICPFCYIKQNERTKHCDICKKCITNFDHHCYYINNCIGKKNNKIFFFFIFYFTIFIFLLCILQILILSGFLNYKQNLDCLQIFYFWKNDKERKKFHFFFIWIYFFISLFFSFSSFFLFFLSAKAFFSGITTYERIKKKYNKNDSEEFLSYVSVSNNSSVKDKFKLSQNSTELNEDKKFEQSLINN